MTTMAVPTAADTLSKTPAPSCGATGKCCQQTHSTVLASLLLLLVTAIGHLFHQRHHTEVLHCVAPTLKLTVAP